ncbi:isoprenyl transferase [Dysgonomonas sp. Marseille-P4677]|uniref:isoprenyl transferase n=1 Tax=Dysgonomonas sp. Marseille-P4677 TaxID=2364790 RepID=UPI0019124B15|nr:isoprenyl transferase [Dysgonomonas sp. Marseille-P4677]MBK5720596.1 isoprenyl transferase [Dysgonomonas sp. Marseille-P4677]
MSLLDQIDKERIPVHVAVIMDGNGRWAKQRDLDRTFGHKEGVSAVRRAIEAASKAEVRFLTLYTFSTENWKRPEAEVKALMSLMIQAVANETPELVKNNVRVKVIGDIDRLPSDTKGALDYCLSSTSVCTGTTVVLALSYSSKWELTNAMRNIAKDIDQKKIVSEDINEDLVNSYLLTKDIPDPDILIRTGGELRISNFLLWQIAYSELYFTDELWPDFNEDSLYKAIIDFQNRERRFGKTSEQVSQKS